MPNTQSQTPPSTTPTILIIIGITGNLSHKKLLPAIERLAAVGALPKQFKLVGVSRRDVTVQNIITSLPDAPDDHEFIREQLEMVQMNLDQPEAYQYLADKLDAIVATMDGDVQKLFYLSVPPDSSRNIIEQLGKTGFGHQSNTKLLLEKPFGSDVASARDLVEYIRRFFDESQVYRIDHYLAKEMAQNILTFRRENPLFRRTWNNEFIERIEVVAAEEIGIEGRATFYEQAGALGDFVQSHLLQLAALTLMDLPLTAHWQDVPGLRLTALQKLHTSPDSAHRGQYKGYADEVKHPDTKTETFVSLRLTSDDPRWQDVPIMLTTGKALGQKYTEIRLHYRQEGDHGANQLILHVQPQEGIELKLWSKHPGFDRELEQVQLAFQYREGTESPQPYEQVFLSAIQGDRTLFTSHDEVLASWQILEPVQQAWSKSSDDLVVYQPGHWPRFVT